MTWTVELPDQPYVAPNDRGHWSKRHEAAKAWRHAAAMCARQAKVPALERVDVTLVVTPPDRRRRDPDRFSLVLKHATDGLVDAGVIRVDDSRHVARSAVEMRPPDGSRLWRWLLVVDDAEEGGAA